MAAFNLQVRISIAECGRIGRIYVRIQVRNARTTDTHVVTEADILSRRGAPLETGRRDHTAVIYLEGRLIRRRIRLPGVFIADTGLDTKIAVCSGEFRISGGNAVVEVIVQAGCRILHIRIPLPEIVQLVGGIVPADILDTGGQAVQGAQRRGKIGLDGVVHGVGASV